MKKENLTQSETKYSYNHVSTKCAVSKHTEQWVTVHKNVQSLFTEIYDLIISEDSGDPDDLYNSDFLPHLTALLKSVERGLSNSVFTALYEYTETNNI